MDEDRLIEVLEDIDARIADLRQRQDRTESDLATSVSASRRTHAAILAELHQLASATPVVVVTDPGENGNGGNTPKPQEVDPSEIEPVVENTTKPAAKPADKPVRKHRFL